MNKVIINTEGISLPSWTKNASLFARKVLKELKKNNWELSILLCGEKTIKELNSKYRKKNEPTDVLSFNLGETLHEGNKIKYLPGDIVISLDGMRKNALNFKITEDEELQRLIIHGILHLDGMDHKTNGKNEPMLVLQENILTRLKDGHIIGGIT